MLGAESSHTLCPPCLPIPFPRLFPWPGKLSLPKLSLLALLDLHSPQSGARESLDLEAREHNWIFATLVGVTWGVVVMPCSLSAYSVLDVVCSLPSTQWEELFLRYKTDHVSALLDTPHCPQNQVQTPCYALQRADPLPTFLVWFWIMSLSIPWLQL